MEKHCNKKAYNSKERALRALHKIQNAQNSQHKECRAYECDTCKGKWHLTSHEIIRKRAKDVKLTHREEWLKLLSVEG